LRATRIAIPRSERRRAAEAAARQLLHLLRGSHRIAVYLSARSELSTAPLIDALLRRGLRVYAPVTLRDHAMRFVPLRRTTPLRRGALGLPQPAATRGACRIGELDAIVLPLLGFDADGRRLGNGGGFYDRALARNRLPRRPHLIGYAFAAQQVDALPDEPWDVPLDTVVTERGIIRCPRRNPAQ
jgi:5-formyltetrahydrofolate cyclo-ligase